MPGKPFQSKLEPFYEFIREGRAKRWSYRKIAEVLGSEHGLSVSPNAVFSFVKVRAKRRKLYALPPVNPSSPSSPPAPLPPNTAGGFFIPLEPPKNHEEKRRPYNI